MLFRLLQQMQQVHLVIIDVPFIPVKGLEFHYSPHFS